MSKAHNGRLDVNTTFTAHHQSGKHSQSPEQSSEMYHQAI